LLKAVLGKGRESKVEVSVFFFSPTKANLNLCQTGLKDVGIRAINLPLSKLKPANNLVANACCRVSLHITFCHKELMGLHRPDRADLL
jgi:hypothetical protein